MRFTSEHNEAKRCSMGLLILGMMFFLLSPSDATSKEIPKKTGSLKHLTLNKYNQQYDLGTLSIDIQNEIQKYIGIPYRSGGAGNKGMDCSGLTRNVYEDLYGVELPHNSYQQSRSDFLDNVSATVEALEPTDLLFFSSDQKRINHVGIYLSDGNFLHAIPRFGVIVSNINSSYWRNRLVTSKRLKQALLAKSQVGDSYSFTVDGKAVLVSQNFSLGYRSSSNSQFGVNIETFLDRNLFAAKETSLWPVNRLNTPLTEDLALLAETWQGFRASVDLRPFNSLRITPSFSLIDVLSLDETSARSWQTYGIEAALSPQGADWSLSVSLRSLLDNHRMDAYPQLDGTDIGLRFKYNFSDTVRVAVSGNWEGIGAETRPMPVNESLAESLDVSFRLGFSF